MPLSEADIQIDLDRRRPGTSRHVTQRNEPDAVEILSGCTKARPQAPPLPCSFATPTSAARDYGNIAQSFRPGHADYTYWHKYGIRDPRGGGSSALADCPHRGGRCRGQKWLQQQYGTRFRVHDAAGRAGIPLRAGITCAAIRSFAPVADVAEYEDYMDALRKAGDRPVVRASACRPRACR